MARPRSKARQNSSLVATPNLGVVPGASSLALLAEIREMITDGDVKLAMETLRDALTAEQNVRAPRGPDGVNQYERTPDWNARLTAIKLLFAYRFGQPPSHQEVHVTHGNAPAAVEKSPDEAMRELVESGADLQKIVGAYVSALKQATPASTPAEKPENRAIPAQIAEKVEVVDV